MPVAVLAIHSKDNKIALTESAAWADLSAGIDGAKGPEHFTPVT